MEKQKLVMMIHHALYMCNGDNWRDVILVWCKELTKLDNDPKGLPTSYAFYVELALEYDNDNDKTSFLGMAMKRLKKMYQDNFFQYPLFN